MSNRNDPQIRQIAIEAIVPFANNPREHPPEQVASLKRSIERFGFNAPLLLNDKVEIIAGHGRLLAATSLSMTMVPCIILGHLSEAEQRAYRIADNQIQLKGTWSPDLLASEVAFILESDYNFDVMDLGFEVPELDIVLTETGKKRSAKTVDPERVSEPDRDRKPVSRIGDVWNVGKHRIICGDAREVAAYNALLLGASAQLVLTDPPWNLSSRQIGGRGKVRHPSFKMASGEMSRDEFRGFLSDILKRQAEFSAPGALAFNFIDWRSIADMIHSGEKIFDALVNVCVWVKPVGGLGGLLRSRHELIAVFRVKGGSNRNNVQLGKFGRNRSNVWEFPSPVTFGSERENLKLHPTAKNVEMLAEAILDCTARNGLVLDPFLGSGSTILAAAKTGRVGRGIELDPAYVDVAVTRIAEELKLPALLEDGRSFDEIRLDRQGA